MRLFRPLPSLRREVSARNNGPPQTRCATSLKVQLLTAHDKRSGRCAKGAIVVKSSNGLNPRFASLVLLCHLGNCWLPDESATLGTAAGESTGLSSRRDRIDSSPRKCQGNSAPQKPLPASVIGDCGPGRVPWQRGGWRGFDDSFADRANGVVHLSLGRARQCRRRRMASLMKGRRLSLRPPSRLRGPTRRRLPASGGRPAPATVFPVAAPATQVEALTILHVDMDAFYASVEQRDRPELRGRPVIVGGMGGRGGACAASYEARPFGVHSAMPMATARRLCREAVYLSPRMTHYAEISRHIRDILLGFTPQVEPLSLDEAFLDVQGCEGLFGPAPEIGRQIEARIKNEMELTASVGVAPNKFLAKLASDHGKPEGLADHGTGN